MTKFQQSMADLEALTARRHEIIKASLTYKFPDAALFPQLDYHHDDNLQYPYDIDTLIKLFEANVPDLPNKAHTFDAETIDTMILAWYIEYKHQGHDLPSEQETEYTKLIQDVLCCPTHQLMELRAMHERNTLATAPLDKPKSVKITAANASKITDWLAAVNGKPTDHTLNDSETLFSLVSTAHNELLDLLGSTKAIVGACLTYRSGQAVSSAQKHVRKNTEIRIEFRAAGAYLTDVVASTVAHKFGEERTLILTEKQDALAIARQRTKYTTDNRQDQDKE